MAVAKYMAVSQLFEKNLHVIQIRKCWFSSHPNEQKCLQDKCEVAKGRPLCKRPCFNEWPDHPASYQEAIRWVHEGGNLAVVGGYASHSYDGYKLTIVDYDERPVPISEGIEFYRRFGTLIAFTPRGYHVYCYIKQKRSLNWILRTTGWPKPDTIRGGLQYAIVPPSRVNGKAYWWLDGGKTPIRRLD